MTDVPDDLAIVSVDVALIDVPVVSVEATSAPLGVTVTLPPRVDIAVDLVTTPVTATVTRPVPDLTVDVEPRQDVSITVDLAQPLLDATVIATSNQVVEVGVVPGPSGPVGPEGPVGPAGPAGPVGPTGPAGLDEVLVDPAQPTNPDTELWYNSDTSVLMVKVGGTWTQITTDAALGYHHVQSTAATVWTIIHNLGFWPNVAVVDSTGRVIIPGAIDYTSTTTVQLTFSAAVGGEAYLS